MKKIYFFLIIIYLVSFQTFADTLELCKNRVSDDLIKNFCFICKENLTSDFLYDELKDIYINPEINEDLNISPKTINEFLGISGDEITDTFKNKIIQLNPDYTIDVFFCTKGDELFIYEHSVIEEQEPVSGVDNQNENQNIITDHDEVSLNVEDYDKDLSSIITIYNQPDINEIDKLMYTLTHNVSNRDKKSFINRYIDKELKSKLTPDRTTSEKIKIYKNTANNLSDYINKQNRALNIYSNNLIKCRSGVLEEQGTKALKNFCKAFKEKNLDNWKIASDFVKIKEGYLDDANLEYPIAQGIVEYFESEINSVSTDENYVNDVKTIQKALKDLKFYKGEIDGDYGQKTINAVKNWRKEFGDPANDEELAIDSDEYKELNRIRENYIKRNQITNDQWMSTVKEALKILKFWPKVAFDRHKSGISKWQDANNYEKTGSFFNKDHTYNKDQYNKLIEQKNNKTTQTNEFKTKLKLIQEYLTITGYYKGGVDGSYGPATKSAIDLWEDRFENVLKGEKLINDFDTKDINDKAVEILKNQSNEIKKEIEDKIDELNKIENNYQNIINAELAERKKSIQPLILKTNTWSESKEYEDFLMYDPDDEDKETNENKLAEYQEKKALQISYIAELNNLKVTIEDIQTNINKYVKDYEIESNIINQNENSYFKNQIYNKAKKELKTINISDSIESLQNQINLIDGSIEKLDIKINEIDEIINSTNWTYIVGGFLLLVVIGGGGIFIFLNQTNKRKKSEKNAELEIQQRKEEMEREQLVEENLRLKQNIEKQVQERIVEEKTLEEEKKILTPEQKDKKDKLDMINQYKDSLKDVSLIDNFQSRWSAIGLKEGPVPENPNKNRTLIRDSKSFRKCNFWAIPYKNEYIIYAGRTLRTNIPALIANDNQWAKEIFKGIFEIINGDVDEIFTHSVAFAQRDGDEFTITMLGKVQIPYLDN